MPSSEEREDKIRKTRVELNYYKLNLNGIKFPLAHNSSSATPSLTQRWHAIDPSVSVISSNNSKRCRTSEGENVFGQHNNGEGVNPGIPMAIPF